MPEGPMDQDFLDSLLNIVNRVDRMTNLITHVATENHKPNPYIESYWNYLSPAHQNLIIKDLYAKNCRDLISFIDTAGQEKYVQYIFSEETGEVLQTKQCDLKIESTTFKQGNPIYSLSNVDKVYEYFKTYTNLKVSVDPMSYSITKNLSPSAAAYLDFLLPRLLGKNFCLIFTRELVEALGKNKYRKSKQELRSKGLLRDVKTKLPKDIKLVQVHPLLMYRGRSIEEDSTPMWKWLKENGPTYQGCF